MASLGDVLARAKAEGRGTMLAYLMAGSVDDSRFLAAVDALRDAGVSGLELGFPFSDPMAEGPVIQRAAADALDRGTHWTNLFSLMRQISPHLPCAVMTYLNPVLQRGVGQALRSIRDAGGSALILPDLPVEEVGPFRALRRSAGVDTVLLASPATSGDRMRRLSEASEGFLYVVSRYGVTGASPGARPGAASAPLSGLLDQASRWRPDLPRMVGFGISRPADVRRMRAAGADGIIVGSAFQELLSGGAAVRKIGRLGESLVAALG